MPSNKPKLTFFERSKNIDHSYWIIGGGVVLFLLASAYLITPPSLSSLSELKIGDKVWEEIKSNADFTVVDEATTDMRRRVAENSVLPVYDYDNGLFIRIDQRLTRLFAQYRQKQREERLKGEIYDQGPLASPTVSGNTDVLTDNIPVEEQNDYTIFLNEAGGKISFETYKLLYSVKFAVELEQGIRQILNKIRDYSIVGNRNLLFQQESVGITKKDLVTSAEANIYNLGLILSIEEAWRDIDLFATQIFPNNQIYQDIGAEVARALMRPNLTLNMQETQRRKTAAKEAVKPVNFKVSKGEIIARAGDRITQEMKIRLDKLNRYHRRSQAGLEFTANLLIVAGLFCLAFLYLARFHDEIFQDRERVLLIFLISILQLVIIRLFYMLTGFLPNLVSKYPYDLLEPYRCLIPFAIGPMLLAMLVHPRIAIFLSFLYGIIASVPADRDFFIGVYALVAGCISTFVVQQYKQRMMILGAGLIVSLGNLVTIAVLQLLRDDPALMLFAFSGLMGIANGLLVSIFVTLLVPLLEFFFKIPTDIRLLELSSFNQPLLRKLAIEAPGTHHHSLLVGDLAESAAEAIGANSLLSKVGAYYHDIGKISKPHYFIENIQGKNPHDELNPSMSAMVIRKHVKDGVELANKHRLSRDIISIIEQHHGTSLMAFIYEKARNIALKEGSQASQEDYRYQGPRPKLKEAAIVMLADSVEAAARSLKSPSPSALKALVQKITLSKFQDRQFDDCDLTFKELSIIANQLFERLLHNYHNRLKYPGFDFDEDYSGNLINIKNQFPKKEA